MLAGRYALVLYLQYVMLIVDLLLNSFTHLFRVENVVLLVLHVLQDVFILFALILIFLIFFNTYIFKAGLVSFLVSKFRLPITVIFVYLALSASLHTWGLTLRWEDPTAYIWIPGYRVLYVLQRLGAVFYYYFYKRTALRLSDNRFYEDSEWIRAEFAKRM